MSNLDQKVRFGIRPKLFVLILVGFGLLIAVTSWRIGTEANYVASDSIDRALEQSELTLETKILSRYEGIQETVISLAKDGRVLPLVYDRESETLQDLSHEFQKALEFDILFITDSEGIILARSDRPEALGLSVKGRSALFDAALSGQTAKGVIESNGRLFQIVAVPVFDNVATDVVRGAIALAYELSPAMSEEINKLTGSGIALFIFERDSDRIVRSAKNLYSTEPHLVEKFDIYFSDNPDVWEKIYQSTSSDAYVFILGDEEFHAVVNPLATYDGQNLGFILTMRSRTELLKPFIKIQKQVIIVGVICLFVASGLPSLC